MLFSVGPHARFYLVNISVDSLTEVLLSISEKRSEVSRMMQNQWDQAAAVAGTNRTGWRLAEAEASPERCI